MTTVQLKSRILSRLESTDNQSLLETIEHMLNAYETTKKDIYELSEDEQKDVNIGLEQMRKGEIVSNEEANRKTREWLREK